MFTHADFNRAGRQIGRAFIYRDGHFYRATVWRFECGDIGFWVRSQFIAWPSGVRVTKVTLHTTFQLFDPGQLGELGTRIDGR